MKPLETIGGEGRKRRKMDPSLSADANRKAAREARGERVEEARAAKIAHETPLIKDGSEIGKYCLLQDHPQVERVLDVIRSKYGDFDFMDLKDEYDDFISNSYFVSAVNEIFRETCGWRVATAVDVELIKQEGELDLGYTSIDLGLVLRSEEGNNEELAKDLSEKIRAMSGMRIGVPLFIPYACLGLEYDGSHVVEGLSFKLLEGAKGFHVPKLNSGSGEGYSSVSILTGLPNNVDNTETARGALYNGSSGLCDLYLDYGDFHSGGENFQDSSEDSRIILVKEGERK